MKKYKILIIISVLLISSCATQSVLPPPQWTFEKAGIHIRLRADSRLNWYGGSAHSLRGCVYQLNEPNAFNQLTDNTEKTIERAQRLLSEASLPLCFSIKIL